MKNKMTLYVILVLALLGQGALHRGVIFDRWSKDYSTARKQGGIAPGLDPTQLLVALAGFRELVAGILWVRADSFFDSGKYDAILPMIRVVTWLDPHQLDVYSTGMWHIAYNFTDEESRSDRRYIPQALALGKEGTENNPDTYELFFETGWIWFHKIDDDYQNAVEWFRKASDKKDMLPARKNLMISALMRDGKIDESLEESYALLAAAEDYVKQGPNSYSLKQIRDTREGNIDTNLVRMVQRGYFANQRKDGSFSTGSYDVNPPFDVGFSAKVTVEDPRVIRVEGTWNVLPVGTRVRVVLRDADGENMRPAALVWDSVKDVSMSAPADVTFMQDQLFVKNRRFNRRIDMNRDQTQYPCSSEKYYLEFYYNPRSAPAHMQDKFGFNGEGMTDKNYINTEVRPGQRVIFARLELTGEMLRREGQYRPGETTPILMTKNFKEPESLKNKNEDLVIVESLRGAGAAKNPPKKN